MKGRRDLRVQESISHWNIIFIQIALTRSQPPLTASRSDTRAAGICYHRWGLAGMDGRCTHWVVVERALLGCSGTCVGGTSTRGKFLADLGCDHICCGDQWFTNSKSRCSRLR